MNGPRQKITNVVSHSFGYITLDEHSREIIVNVIRKQDPLPCSVSKSFFTTMPNQATFELTLMENEYLTDIVRDISSAKELGNAVIDNLPPGLPQGSQIDVTFELDNQGHLHIEAVLALSGIRSTATIQTTEGLTDEELQDILRHQTAISEQALPQQFLSTLSTLRIFVSHSHEDAAFCQALVTALRDAGADVWYDEDNLGAGNLMNIIQRELGQRKIFIVILSKHAFASAWVRRETGWAYELAAHDPTRVILPVTAAAIELGDLSPEAGWLFLRDFKRIELPGGQPYPKAEAIGRVVAAMQAIA